MSSALDNIEEVNQISKFYRASILKKSVTDFRYSKIRSYVFHKEEDNYFLGML